MTVEKAIEILSDVGDINRCCAEDAEALDMAIKALEQQPCEDCISRKEMLKYQEYLHGKMSNEENHKLWEFIKQLPPVQPTRPNGEWIFTTEGNIDHITCSICGRDSMGTFDYCPNCGAKMEG